MERLKILIVEDHKTVSLGIRKMLERLGHEITEIVDQAEDVEKSIGTLPPDVVLMDIWLRGEMDGIEATEIINTKWDIPVIYVTARTDVPTIMRANRTRHCGYLKKPIDITDLKITIEGAFKKAGQRAL